MTVTGRAAVPMGIRELVATRVPGRCLASPFYTDREVFELDVEAIFARHWVFVASEPEIPEAGDYVTVQVGTYSVILVRDDDDSIRGFHNVCRHRGSRLLHDPRGSVGNIVCGYHKWTYSVDGTLLHTESPPAGFEPSCFGLKPVHIRTLDGLIFMCLADEAPADFADAADTIGPYLGVHGLKHTKVAAQIDIVEDGNWKLVMENNRECYHCDGHPELICSMFQLYGYAEQDVTGRLRPAFERYQSAEARLEEICSQHDIPVAVQEQLDGRPTGFRVGRSPLDLAGESFSQDGRLVSSKLLGTVPSPQLGHLGLHMQPNSWFHFLSDHVVTFSVLPLAADRTSLRTTWLVHEDAVEGVDYDPAALTRVWQATNAQDSILVSRTQAGVSSPSFEPGPYARTEYQVDAFVRWYIDRLSEYLGQ